MGDTGQNVRQYYNLDHQSHHCGEIGRLMTLSTIPVVAGDSIDIDYNGIFSLSTLRRPLYMDCKVDLFIFYQPYRHIYSNWTDFLLQGIDEGINLGTVTTDATAGLKCTGFPFKTGQTIPTWASAGYVNIWNNYFRHPADGNLHATTWLDSGGGASDKDRLTGLLCCNLKKMWNTAMETEVAAADYQWATGGTMDLIVDAQQRARFQTERMREWFAPANSGRYRDALKAVWDTYVNVDADQRPTLLARSENWLSGQEVNGTDAATLGSSAGKSQAICSIKMPPKLFYEHGTINVMALLRFPPTVLGEIHYLATEACAEPTYQEISGDPTVARSEPPLALDLREIHNDATLADAGMIPYYQWYREHPSSVSDRFATLGHPFVETGITSVDEAHYVMDSEYGRCFVEEVLYQWQANGYLEVNAKRHIPDQRASIFAGTK